MTFSATPFIPGIINLRDVGGYPTAVGGHVATGRLFRSGQLNFDDEAGRAAFASLGVTTVFDLRSVAECRARPDCVPSGISRMHLDVLADHQTSLAAHIVDLFKDPVAANELLRSGTIQQHYLDTYIQLVCSTAASTAYRQMFMQIADLNEPGLFHCTAGKDRTGWAAAALLTLLGVPQQIVLEDYLLSAEPVVAWFQPYLDRFAAGGGNQELLKPVFSVEPAYLAASMRQVELNFGSIQGYFHVGLGLSEAVIQRLRMRMLS